MRCIAHPFIWKPNRSTWYWHICVYCLRRQFDTSVGAECLFYFNKVDFVLRICKRLFYAVSVRVFFNCIAIISVLAITTTTTTTKAVSAAVAAWRIQMLPISNLKEKHRKNWNCVVFSLYADCCLCSVLLLPYTSLCFAFD